MKYLLYPLAAGLILANAWLHGAWTGRWNDDATILAAQAERVEALPLTLGDWEGEALEVDPRTVRKAGLVGHISRRYRNRLSGGEITMMLVCGRPGPISVHTPEICYRGAGYEMADAAVPFPVTGTAHAFWLGVFQKPKPSVAPPLKIYWAWNADGSWQAPGNPRLCYAHCPALFKLYVVNKLTPSDNPSATDAAQEFLQRVIPVLEPLLRTPS